MIRMTSLKAASSGMIHSDRRSRPHSLGAVADSFLARIPAEPDIVGIVAPVVGEQMADIFLRHRRVGGLEMLAKLPVRQPLLALHHPDDLVHDRLLPPLFVSAVI